MSMEMFLIVFYLFIGLTLASGAVGVGYKRAVETTGIGVGVKDIFKRLHVIIFVVIAWPLVIAFLFGAGELGQGTDKEGAKVE